MSALRRWILRLAFAALLVGALAYVPYRVFSSDGYVRYGKMSAELDELDRGNQALREQNQFLRREIHRLRDDLDAVGAVARDELGLVRPGEIVIQVERDP